MHGDVFFDENLNGIKDPGEPDLEGSVLRLIKDGQVIATTVTHSPYEFTNIAPGTYDLEVIVQPGQIATTPVVLEAVVTVSGSCVMGPDFGIYDNNLVGSDSQVSTLLPPDTRFTSSSVQTVSQSTTGSHTSATTTTTLSTTTATQPSAPQSSVSTASAAKPISGTKPAYTGRASGPLAGLGVALLLLGALLTLSIRRKESRRRVF